MRNLRAIVKVILKGFARIISLLPLRYIVFESIPDYSDNTRAVFDEMIRRGLKNHYKFIWLCTKSNIVIPIEGVKCVHNRIFQLYYIIRSKCLISCNTFIYSFGHYQKAIYLCHGVPIKTFGYKAPAGIDYVIGLSAVTNLIQSRELSIDVNKILTLGYPRNDSLYSKSRKEIGQFFDGEFNKIIIWYPTFRQHCSSNIPSATKYSIPIIHNPEDAIQINEIAKAENVLIVLKPHFSQDTSFIKDLSLSNILFIDDRFFLINNITSYELVGACDALITDYSSVYFDYLLCNKPVAAIWEDIDEYRKNRGFAIDVDYYMKGAVKIMNVDDYTLFIRQVANGIDSFSKQREEILDVVHKYKDNKSAKRVVDFIEDKILN